VRASGEESKIHRASLVRETHCIETGLRAYRFLPTLVADESIGDARF
jgi:hypothetical protein